MMEDDDDLNVDDSFSSDSPKKHKKIKKHKAKHDKHERHKKKRKHSVSNNVGDSDPLASPQPSIKLKIKIGGQTLSSKSVSVAGEEAVKQGPGMSRSSSAASMQSWQTLKDDVFRTKRSDDDTSDEEREWLQALEAGELDDSGAVKKSRDPKLLTARQRALIHGDREGGLLELPSGYKSKEMTEEQLQRRQQRAKKRREQAHEKREKDKKQTLDRILKKQETSKSKLKGKGGRRSQTPGFHYNNTAAMVTISVPHGCQFPFPAQSQKDYKDMSCMEKGHPRKSDAACTEETLKDAAPQEI